MAARAALPDSGIRFRSPRFLARSVALAGRRLVLLCGRELGPVHTERGPLIASGWRFKNFSSREGPFD
jgi:hypothetical protein